ncbi:hypothetical protein HED51_11005 [Ochrobactrum grignonense]|nr:hypothetical protein [Brucella grignonensis]
MQAEDLLAEMPIQLCFAISVRVRESSSLLRSSFAFVEVILFVKRALSLGLHCCIGCVVVHPAISAAVAINVTRDDTRKNSY